jgi:hypothetical protein
MSENPINGLRSILSGKYAKPFQIALGVILVIALIKLIKPLIALAVVVALVYFVFKYLSSNDK